MPNHTSTILELRGIAKQINAFIKAVKTDDNNMDFNGVVPMPEEIRNTSSPVKIMTQEEIDKQWEAFNALPEEKRFGRVPFALGITKEMNRTLIAKYGTNNWYDWALANWGTKWGAYDAGEWKDNSIFYQTAWSPATQFLLKASELFPSVHFKHYFADEGGGFLGWEDIFKGEVRESAELDWDSEAGIELRKKLGVYHDEDEN
jgi:hypothetical protein